MIVQNHKMGYPQIPPRNENSSSFSLNKANHGSPSNQFGQKITENFHKRRRWCLVFTHKLHLNLSQTSVREPLLRNLEGRGGLGVGGDEEADLKASIWDLHFVLSPLLFSKHFLRTSASVGGDGFFSSSEIRTFPLPEEDGVTKLIIFWLSQDLINWVFLKKYS